MKPAPSRLAPVFVPRIWGARSLEPLFDIVPGPEPIGEVWFAGDHCEFASGPLAGHALGEVWHELPAEWTGRALRGLPRIPLLVKFLFPAEQLSVQVHPGDEYARVHEAAAGGLGKTEMWYAIAAEPGAELGLGFNAGVTAEGFRRAIAEGTVQRCLHQFRVNEGDAFFVPAGTVHTIGPRMILCEVQEHSDLTYRVFDFNRLQADGTPRALHLRQALEVIRFETSPGGESGGRAEPVVCERGPLRETFFVACPHFATERWEFSQPVAAATSAERFELLIPFAGSGCVESGGELAEYHAGEVWLLPAALGEYRLVPEAPTKLLRTYVPDIGEFSRRLASRGIARAECARLVHA